MIYIYIAGNMSKSKLYLNKGSMQFEDITNKAGIHEIELSWKTGVTMAGFTKRTCRGRRSFLQYLLLPPWIMIRMDSKICFYAVILTRPGFVLVNMMPITVSY